MLKINTQINRFGKQGEKTGWTYIEISAKQITELKSKTKGSFRVKGYLDKHPIRQCALLPMGDGKFILPLKSALQKTLRKKAGDFLTVNIKIDKSRYILSSDLMACLQDMPTLLFFFKSLPSSHQKYYSNWIEVAKTQTTKTKRIVKAMEGFSNQQNFSEMMRSNKSRSQ